MAGTRLAIYGDELSERQDLTREFVGIIFLAPVTQLPEIVTTIIAAQVDNAALVLGNMFGGITMQTAIVASYTRIFRNAVRIVPDSMMSYSAGNTSLEDLNHQVVR